MLRMLMSKSRSIFSCTLKPNGKRLNVPIFDYKRDPIRRMLGGVLKGEKSNLSEITGPNELVVTRCETFSIQQ